MIKYLFFRSDLRLSSWVVLASLLTAPLVKAAGSSPDQGAVEEESRVTITCPRPTFPTQTAAYQGPLDIPEIVINIARFLTAPQDIKAFSSTSKFMLETLNPEVLRSVQIQMSEAIQDFSPKDKAYIRQIYGPEVDCVHHALKALTFIKEYKKKLEDHKRCMALKEALPKIPGFDDQDHSMHYARLARLKPHRYPQYQFLAEGTDLEQSRRLYQRLIENKIPTPHLRTIMTYFSDLSPDIIQLFATIPTEQFDIMAREWNTLEDIFPKDIQKERFEKKLAFFSPLPPRVIDALARNYRRIVHPSLDSVEVLKKLSRFSAEKLDALGRNFVTIYQSLFGLPGPVSNETHDDRQKVLSTLSSFSPSQLDCMAEHSSTLSLTRGSYWTWKKQLKLLKGCEPKKIEALVHTLKEIGSAFKSSVSDNAALLEIIGGFSSDELAMLRDNIADLATIYPELRLRRLLEMFPCFGADILKKYPKEIRDIEAYLPTNKLPKFSPFQVEAFKKHQGFLSLVSEGDVYTYRSLLEKLPGRAPNSIDALGGVVQTLQHLRQNEPESRQTLLYRFPSVAALPVSKLQAIKGNPSLLRLALRYDTAIDAFRSLSDLQFRALATHAEMICEFIEGYCQEDPDLLAGFFRDYVRRMSPEQIAELSIRSDSLIEKLPSLSKKLAFAAQKVAEHAATWDMETRRKERATENSLSLFYGSPQDNTLRNFEGPKEFKLMTSVDEIAEAPVMNDFLVRELSWIFDRDNIS